VSVFRLFILTATEDVQRHLLPKLDELFTFDNWSVK